MSKTISGPNEAPLSLVPQDDDGTSKDSTEYATFKLKASPGNDASKTKYGFTMAKVDGTQSVRQHLKWVSDLNKVYVGMRMESAPDKQRLAEQMCSGGFKTAYMNGIEKAINIRWKADTTAAMNTLVQEPNETEESFLARKVVANNDVPKPVVIESADRRNQGSFDGGVSIQGLGKTKRLYATTHAKTSRYDDTRICQPSGSY